MKNINQLTLIQPENSHRFSTDALLLAQFAPIEKTSLYVELGCGCGIISLEFQRRKTSMQGLGLDCAEELILAAKENLKLYNFEKFIEFIQEDINNLSNSNLSLVKQFKNKSDLVICNPPWLLENEGKLPTENLKKNALFGNQSTYNLFFYGAKFFLKENGLLSFITIPSNLERVIGALKKNSFLLEGMQFVHKDNSSNANFILALAKYKGKSLANSKAKLKILPPLFL